MRPPTIVLAVLTVLSAAATTVLAITSAPAGTLPVLRLGGVLTVLLGVSCVIVTANQRRRDRLRRESDAHPGTVFVTAHPTDTTARELAGWSPGLSVGFPCDLGFDADGMTAYPGGAGTPTRIASPEEITGFDVFDQPTPLGSTRR